MPTSNPYASPNAESSVENVVPPPRPPYLWSTLLLVIGSGFLLLLNGQVFTNTLVFLASVTVSGAFWLRYIVRSHGEQQTRLGIYVLLAHIMIWIAFAVGLPARIRRQQEFNQTTSETIQRIRKAAQ